MYCYQCTHHDTSGDITQRSSVSYASFRGRIRPHLYKSSGTECVRRLFVLPKPSIQSTKSKR